MTETPEVLDAPSTDLAPVVQSTGVEPAEAMLWRHFGKLGNMLSQSAFVPSSFRTKVRDENGDVIEIVKPVEVMAAIAYGHEIGLGPMQSLQSFDVIQGKPTLKPETMRAMIRAHGHSLARIEANDERVTFVGTRRDTGDTETVTYTIEDARALGLAGKDNWKKQPRAMLTARCTAEIARSLFSDVIAGASYTPEEMGEEPVEDDTRRQEVARAVLEAGPDELMGELPTEPDEAQSLAAAAVDEAALRERDELVEMASGLVSDLATEAKPGWIAFMRSNGLSSNPERWTAAQARLVIGWCHTPLEV